MFKKIAASSIATLLVATPHAAFAQEAQPVKVGDHLVLKLEDGKTHLCSPGLLVGNVLLTAGHCGPAGTPVFDENDNQLGTLEYFPDNPYDKESTAANDKGYVKLNVPTSREDGPVDPKDLEPYYGPIDKDNDEVCAWSTMANEERCGKIVGMYPGSIDYDFTMIKGDSGTAVYIKGKGTIATHGVSNHENGTAYGSLLPAMDVINDVTKPEDLPSPEDPDAPAEENPDAPVEDNPDAPAEDTPDAPVDNGSENPDAPAENSPNAPVEENPDAPVEENPEDPADNSENPDNPAEENPEDTTDNNPEDSAESDSEDPDSPVDNNPTGTTSKNPEAPAEDTTNTTEAPTEGTTDNTAENTKAPVEESPAEPTDTQETPTTQNPTPTSNSRTALNPQKVYEQRVQPPAPDAENNYAVGTPEQQAPDNTGENNTQRTLASTGANVLLIAGIAALLLCVGIAVTLFRKNRH